MRSQLTVRAAPELFCPPRAAPKPAALMSAGAHGPFPHVAIEVNAVVKGPGQIEIRWCLVRATNNSGLCQFNFHRYTGPAGKLFPEDVDIIDGSAARNYEAVIRPSQPVKNLGIGG